VRHFKAQLERWLEEELTAKERKQVDALAVELVQAAGVIDSVMEMAEELIEGSIELLAKSEL
jgi:hypothetical protein